MPNRPSIQSLNMSAVTDFATSDTQLRTLGPHAEPMEARITNSDRRTNQAKRPKWVRGAVE